MSVLVFVVVVVCVVVVVNILHLTYLYIPLKYEKILVTEDCLETWQRPLIKSNKVQFSIT